MLLNYCLLQASLPGRVVNFDETKIARHPPFVFQNAFGFQALHRRDTMEKHAGPHWALVVVGILEAQQLSSEQFRVKIVPWTPVEGVLVALRQETAQWRNLSERDLQEVVESSSKRRHEIAGGRIRALYGHSVPGRLLRTQTPPPAQLFHGTSPEALARIRESGLLPMARQYVHLSVDRAGAVEVGRRKARAPVVLIVKAGEAAAAGIAFYAGNEKVWLADGVPWPYLAVDGESLSASAPGRTP